MFNTTYFNIKVSNTGSVPIKGMQLGFYLDNQALKYYNVSLPPHSSANITENYTYVQNGTYNFSVVADPSHILDISNSSITYSQVSINVSNPQQPNIYPYIPSKGTNSTYTFTLFPRGMAFSSLLAPVYNVSQFKPLLGPDPGISFAIMHDLSGALNLGNGVFSKYNNGTEVYGLWLEGTINNSDIRSILSTYPFKQQSFEKGSSQAVFAKINDTISFCSYSSKGWTKLFVYYNGTNAGNCKSMLSTKYNDTEYNLLSNISSLHAREYPKSANFTYSNATEEGFGISLEGMNYSLFKLSQIRAALFNAASLFSKLNITNSYTKWEPLDNNTCSFSNASIGCTYKSFNQTSKKYTIKITNNLGQQIRIDSLGCSSFLPVNATISINETLKPSQSLNATFACRIPPINIGSAVQQFFLNMSYSVNGKQMFTKGQLTYANFYVG